MNSEPTLFEEGIVDNEGWSHYKYQYLYAGDVSGNLPDEIYDWCLHNITGVLGWYILWNGVIIFEKEDAMAFKLRWL